MTRASKRSASRSGDIAKRKDRATALARLIVAQGFFWEGEKGGRADKRKPGIDNLARAIGLNGQDGSGWGGGCRFRTRTRPACRCLKNKA